MLNRAARQGLGRALASERTVRSDMVVVVVPGCDQLPGVAQVVEDVLVEAFLAQPSVEALGEGVLDWLARANEVELDAACMRPRIECAPGELRAVIDDDRLREAVQLAGTVEPGATSCAGRPWIAAMRACSSSSRSLSIS